MIPLVYSSNYNIRACGLEKLHPFDSVKYQRIHDWLVRQGLRTKTEFVSPQPVPWRDLLRVHSPKYLRCLGQRAELARILEVAVVAYLPACLTSWRVLTPMRWATGGTRLACHLALEQGIALNLGGGFHHAAPDRGGGFCVFADVPLALASVYDDERIRSALIVDTDVHQGDGTAHCVRTWDWVHLLDLFEAAIFPWPKADEDTSVPLPSLLVGVEYLDTLREYLPPLLDKLRPDLVVYNAGSDVLCTDPLATLQLTPEEMADRDLMVVTEARQRDIPIAMVLSGGYGPLSWEAHARSIEAILARFDRSA